MVKLVAEKLVILNIQYRGVYLCFGLNQTNNEGSLKDCSIILPTSILCCLNLGNLFSKWDQCLPF